MTITANSLFAPRLLASLIPAAEERLQRLRKIPNVRFLRLEDYCRGRDGSWGYNSRADGDVSYGDLKDSDCPESAEDYLRALSADDTDSGEVYFYVPVASGSDYSGSTVERSNYLSFLESYGAQDYVFSAYGGYSTYAAVVGLTGLLTSADDTAGAILEALEGLADYPLLDDEALSALESEESDSAWETWAAHEFRRAVEKRFDGCADFNWPADSDLRAFFEKCAESANEYWYNEGYGHDMYIGVDKIVESIDLDDLDAYTVWYAVTFCDVGIETEVYSAESEAIARVAQLRATGFFGAFYTT